MPERSCIGCGRKTAKDELLRFVRREDATLLFDESQREAGRGGYLCPQEACFASALKKRRLSVRFRREVREDLSSLLDRVRHRLQPDLSLVERIPGRPGDGRTGGKTSIRIPGSRGS